MTKIDKLWRESDGIDDDLDALGREIEAAKLHANRAKAKIEFLKLRLAKLKATAAKEAMA